MKPPTSDQFRLAALWLRSNEGEVEERTACATVADYLEGRADAAAFRALASEAGLPVKMARTLAFRNAVERRLST